MILVNLNKDFSERIGKYDVGFSNIGGISTVHKGYYDCKTKEDLEVSVVMIQKDGIVSELYVRVDVINVKKVSNRRYLIALEEKKNIEKWVEQIKGRHNNVLDIDFVRDVVKNILNLNTCNRYEVVVEEEANVVEEEANVVEKAIETKEVEKAIETKEVEKAIETKKVDKIGFNKSFEVMVNGLAKTYSFTTEEVESEYGYTDLLCKMEAISTIIVNDEYAVIRVYAEVYDGVVINLHIGKSRVHKQVESLVSLINAKNVSNEVNELVDIIRYTADNYAYEKDYAFAESMMVMVLNLNSYNSNTCLYNEETYSLAQIA